MEYTQHDRDLLEETRGDIKTLLERVGENGKGLCGRVEEHEHDIRAHDRALHKLWLVVAFAAGSGGIAGGTFLSKVLGG
jgi:hypothetical protein